MSPPDTGVMAGQQVARKTARGIFWNYLSFGLGKGLIFLTLMILARLLTPEEFGLVALATLAISYLSVLKDFGLGAALIQRRQDIEEAANTVFTMNLIVGGLLTLATVAVAPAVAAYFDEPLVTPVLRWLGLTFALNAIGAVHIVRLQRELEFGRKLIPDLGRSAVKGLVSVGLALSGYGVWSLVIGQLAGVLTAVILAWVVFPWRPRLRIKLGLARRLLKFGLSLMGLDGIHAVESNFDYLIVGRLFSNTALGIYTMAYRLPELLGLTTLWIIAGALFPAFSSLQDRPALLRQSFLATLKYVELLMVPIAVGLFLVADPLVRVAFGRQWLEAIPVVRVLALFVLVISIGFNAGDIYKALGRPDILIKIGLLNLSLLLPALWIGAQFGLVGVALGHLVVGTFVTGIRLGVATRFVKVGLGEVLQQLKPSFLSGLVLVLFALPGLYLSADMPPLVRLIVVTIVGAAGYLLPLWLLERDSLLAVARVIGRPGQGPKAVPATLALSSSTEAESG